MLYECMSSEWIVGNCVFKKFKTLLTNTTGDGSGGGV